MQADGLIGAKESTVTALQTEDLTDAQKCDARYYGDGRVIVFNQKCRGFLKGEVGRLVTMLNDRLVVETADRISPVPFAQVSHLTVCKKQEMKLAPGDRLQLKANDRTAEGRHLNNGELVTVKKVDKSGKIHLEDDRIMPPEYRQFVRGYAVTSYASQGKTVDHVLFSDSAIKAATNDQQWYVTISRGRRSVKIFTTDKAQLRENVTRSGKEPLAVEVTGQKVPMVFIGNRYVPRNSPAYRQWRHKKHLRHEAVKQWLHRPSKTQTQQNYDTLRPID